MVFAFACREPLPGFPLLIDPTGVYVRPEGDLYIAGGTPPPENDPPATDFEVDHAFFEETIWPVLAARVPAFEAIRPGRAWAGHYDMNLFDHNAIVGPLPGIAGILIATGFSGHGLQQAPGRRPRPRRTGHPRALYDPRPVAARLRPRHRGPAAARGKRRLKTAVRR